MCKTRDGSLVVISFTANYAGKISGRMVPVMPTAEQEEKLKHVAAEIGLDTELGWYRIEGY